MYAGAGCVAYMDAQAVSMPTWVVCAVVDRGLEIVLLTYITHRRLVSMLTGRPRVLDLPDTVSCLL